MPRSLRSMALMPYLHDFCRFFFFLGVIVLEGQRQAPTVIVLPHQLLTHRHDREIAAADLQPIPAHIFRSKKHGVDGRAFFLLLRQIRNVEVGIPVDLVFFLRRHYRHRREEHSEGCTVESVLVLLRDNVE